MASIRPTRASEAKTRPGHASPVVAKDTFILGETSPDIPTAEDDNDAAEPSGFKFLPLEALTPTPGTEHSFVVKNNKFAFSPGQLSKLLNPKSHQAFFACGGLDGLETGLRTNRRSGLSVDEGRLDGEIPFQNVAPDGTEPYGRYKSVLPAIKEPESDPQSHVNDIVDHPFTERKAVFGTHSFPPTKAMPAKEIIVRVIQHRSIVLFATMATLATAWII